MEIADALIVVDVQRDFIRGGALPALDTETLIAPLNRLIAEADSVRALCVFTRDWHPARHHSFVSQGGRWPSHCVAGSRGADFAAGLTIPHSAHVVNKGVSRDSEGYSAFDDTDLEAHLRNRRIGSIAIAGIATEHCVAATASDALGRGFEVTVLRKFVRAVDLSEGTRTLHRLAGIGVKMHDGSAWTLG